LDLGRPAGYQWPVLFVSPAKSTQASAPKKAPFVRKAAKAGGFEIVRSIQWNI
jgi:hypothetical protein